MNRAVVFLLIGAACLGVGWAAYQAVAPEGPPLSSYVPSGALLYLQAKDLSSLLPDMNFLTQMVGTQSALALYDIGKLQFLYITRLPSASSMQSALWQTRSKFETRSVGGVTFYLRRDPESEREVAFAVNGDYLLLATREDLMAGALQVMARSKDRTIEAEPWWSQSL